MNRREDIARKIQESFGPDWDEILDIDELYKLDELRRLFASVEDAIRHESWYQKPSEDLHIDSKRNLYAAFANSLFREEDRLNFGNEPEIFYNRSTTIPKTEFWKAIADAMRLDAGAGEEVGTTHGSPILEYSLVTVSWSELLSGVEDRNIRLNLGEDFPRLEPKIPRYQRPRRWTKDKIKGFVRSLKKGNPIPSLTVYLDEHNNCYEILDGQQRLESAIYSYSLWKDAISPDTKIGVYVVKGSSGADEMKVRSELVELYKVLNTGGVNLSPLEVIVGTYHRSALIEELIDTTRTSVLNHDINDRSDVANQGSWKSHLRDMCSGKKSYIAEGALQSTALSIGELEVVNHLLRPLVYGHKDGNVFLNHGLSTMKGIERLCQEFSSDDVAEVIPRLVKAFNAAYSVFNHEDVGFLKMASGINEEGSILWQRGKTLNKTATALQVGAFYSNLSLDDFIDSETAQAIREQWKEFIKSKYLDDNGKARNQNAASLWKWQLEWSDSVRSLTENMEPMLTEDEIAILKKVSSKLERTTLIDWFEEN